MSKIRVFISSAMRELENEREIAEEAIKELYLDPVMFEGFPAMDKFVEDAYLEEVKKCNLFLLLLWKDFMEAVEREYNTAVENDIPVLVFVKQLKVGENRSQKLDTFLGKKIEKGKIKEVPFYKEFRSLKELKAGIKRGLSATISRKLLEPVLTTSSVEDISKMALSIVERAKRRLLVIYRTPIILFGPRPYDSELERHQEKEFYDTIINWVEKMVEDDSRRCLYLYSYRDSKKEMKNYRLNERVKTNIEKFKEIEEKTQCRFELSSISEYPGKILVGDNRFGIWFRGPKDKVISIFQTDENISKNMMDLFYLYRGASAKTVNELLVELDIEH